MNFSPDHFLLYIVYWIISGGTGADFNDPMLEIEQFSEIKDRWEIVSSVKLKEKMSEAKGAGIMKLSKLPVCFS